jgi:hypothetical protein
MQRLAVIDGMRAASFPGAAGAVNTRTYSSGAATAGASSVLDAPQAESFVRAAGDATTSTTRRKASARASFVLDGLSACFDRRRPPRAEAS